MILSIIVPVFNGRNFIKKSIENLTAISIPDMEIIYVDDGSTDDSADIIESYTGWDDRIKLIRKDNGGPGSARNEGLMMAAGRFVVFVDSDDRLDIAWFTELVRIADEGDLDLLQYEYRLVDENGRSIEEHQGNGAGLKDRIMTGAEYLRCNGTGGSLQVSYIYKRQMLMDNNIRMAEGVIHEDVEYVAKVLWFAQKLYISERCVYNYTMRQGSIMHTKGRVHKIDFGSSVSRLVKFAQSEVDEQTYKEFFVPYIALNYYNIAHVALQNGMSIRKIFRDEPELKREILNWLAMAENKKYKFQYICLKNGFYELYSLFYKIYNRIRVSHIQG